MTTSFIITTDRIIIAPTTDDVYALGLQHGHRGQEPSPRFVDTTDICDAYHKGYALGVQERWAERSEPLRKAAAALQIKRSVESLYVDALALARRQLAQMLNISLKDARLLARQAARI